MLKSVIHYTMFYTFICPQNKVLEYAHGWKLAELKERFPDHAFQESLVTNWDYSENNVDYCFDGDRPPCSC